MNFNTGTREYMESIFNGQTPVERENPLKGQSKYFYFKPGQRDDISVSDMETVDVPTADTPNPFLSGTSTNPYPSPIQNEIYNKDRSTYNQPYGSPTTQVQSQFGIGNYVNPLLQPNIWSSPTNSNSGFDSSTVSQYLNNATNQLINVRKNNDNSLNFAENASNLYNDMRQEYLGPRNYQNRYKQGCIPSNVAYNTISNYQISSNPKLIENGNIVSNFTMEKVLSKIPIAGKYINRIAIGEKIGNGLANFYNALDEAGCFK